MIQQTNNIPAIYTEARKTIKTAILQGQYEALKGENRIQSVYYSVGKYVSQNSMKGQMGNWCACKHKQSPQKDTPGIARIFCGKFKK